MPEDPVLQTICAGILPALSESFRDREIQARFYPYIGLTHTIRRRGASWVIRISDHCRPAPRRVLEGIVTLLACKVLRRRPPAWAAEIYESYTRLPEIEQRLQARRQARGRKRMEEGPGRHHSLDEIFGELNRLYFNNQVEVRRLGWGKRRSWRRLGHYDPVHRSITISPVLDATDVPRPVLSYLLYHEMLHALFHEERSQGRYRHHTPQFARAERAFPHFESARRFLDRFCRKRRSAP